MFLYIFLGWIGEIMWNHNWLLFDFEPNFLQYTQKPFFWLYILKHFWNCKKKCKIHHLKRLRLFSKWRQKSNIFAEKICKRNFRLPLWQIWSKDLYQLQYSILVETYNKWSNWVSKWSKLCCDDWKPVSYTHLTLPTIYSV